MMQNMIEGLVHLAYPRLCPGCGSDAVSLRQPVCITCLPALPYTNFAGIPDNAVEKIFWGRIPVHAAAALLYFDSQSVVRSLLHQLKYDGGKEIGLYFGRQLGTALKNSTRFDGIDVLLPLPLHAKRLRKRGYNQAEMICRGISKVWPVPISDRSVARIRATATQTFRNRIERWQNMETVFAIADATPLAGKHVLLVDDIITTGATVEACGTALLNIEGVRISIASVAFTLL